MKKLNLKRIALTATMATVMGASTHALAQSVEPVEIPVEGGVFMHETADGQTILMSGDGRFVMPGRLVDRKEGSEVISTIEGAKKAYEGAVANQHASVRNQSQNVIKQVLDTDMLKYQVGDQDGNKEEVVVFIDPLCPYCHRVLNMQQELTDSYVFVNVVVPLLGPRSNSYVSQLSCVDPAKLGETVLNKDQNPEVTETCRDEDEATARRVANSIGINSVPVIYSKTGGRQVGAFRSTDQFKAFLEGGG